MLRRLTVQVSGRLAAQVFRRNAVRVLRGLLGQFVPRPARLSRGWAARREPGLLSPDRPHVPLVLGVASRHLGIPSC